MLTFEPFERNPGEIFRLRRQCLADHVVFAVVKALIVETELSGQKPENFDVALRLAWRRQCGARQLEIVMPIRTVEAGRVRAYSCARRSIHSTESPIYPATTVGDSAAPVHKDHYFLQYSA
jgi:hypothetical protein